MFRKELSDTVAELNASYTQLANVEAVHLTEITALREEMAAAAASAAHRELTLSQEADQRHRECSDLREEQLEARHTIAELERYIAASGGEKERYD